MAEALKAYPFPEGMAIPHLMPFQEYPFNGDPNVAAEVLRLKEKHGLRCAFETGTCLGSSTAWLAQNFGFVTTTEISPTYYHIAVARLVLIGKENYELILARSPQEPGGLLDELRSQVGYDTLCFLDAHAMDGRGGKAYATVLKELEAIAAAKVKPCILLHDFQVPGLPEAGFDSYNGQPFTLEWIRPYLDRIYGEGKWRHNYPTEVAGAKRGWISIEPA